MRSIYPTSLVVAAGFWPMMVSAQASWTGATDNDWATETNWSGGAVPTGAQTVLFDSNPANNEPHFATDTSVGALNFASGAGSYVFKGSALTLGTGTVISNSSGQTQRFENRVNFSDNAPTIDVSAGSEITFASVIGKKDGAPTAGTLIVTGAGVVNFNGSFTDYALFGTLRVMAGSTVNFATTTQNGFNTYEVRGGRLNLHRSPAAGGNALEFRGNGGEIYLSTAGLSVSMDNGLRLRGDGGSGQILTFGANFAGTGTATFGSSVQLNRSGAGTNQTYRLFAAANNTLVLSGVIHDANVSGAGTKVEITGPGVVRYAGAANNTSVTPILISDGTLELAKTGGAIAIAGGAVTIDNDGTLRLAASHQITDATALTFTGGLFDVGEFTESLGALSVGAEGATIDFGGQAGSVSFASLESLVGTITVTGWSESASIYFVDGSGWDPETLAKVIFDGWGEAVFDEATGSLYAAIPEPSTSGALMGSVFLGLALLCNKRRR